MGLNELWDNIEGIYAYDTGSVDSGIKNEELRQQCAREIEAMDETELRMFLSTQLRAAYLDLPALEKGYGYEDVYSFCQWFDDGGLLAK